MGVGADGAELRSEDASRRAEGAQDGRKHGALERRSGSVFLKERARRSDKAGTWSQGVTPTKETFGLASSQKTYREPLKAGIQPWGSETSGERARAWAGTLLPPQGRRKMGAGWLQTVSSFCFELNLARQRDRDRQRQTENKRDRSRSFSSWEALRSYPHLHLSFHRIPASAPTPNELAIIPFHKYPNLSGLTKVVQLATIDLGTQNWVWIWYRSSLALKDTGSSDFGAYHWWENKTSNFSSVVGDGSSEIIKRYSTMICAACRYKQTYHTIA